ncbi:hypothetical protein JCM1840_003189 [Sporobolomyces johnsonii]
MPVLAFGANLHGQIPGQDSLTVSSPVTCPGCIAVAAASWSQAVFRDSTPAPTLRGLPLGPDSLDLASARTWLGQDSFVAALLHDGHILRFDDGNRSAEKYSLASMNSRGELLVVPGPSSLPLFSFPPPLTLTHPTTESNPLELRLYPSVAALFAASAPSSSPPASPTLFTLPAFPSSPSSPEHIHLLSSGASHSLLLALPSHRLFSLGDNRFGQCGAPSLSPPSSSAPTLNRIEALDGLYPVEIACGAFHSAVRTQDGSVYVFGTDKEGQGGGIGAGCEPLLVELGLEGDESGLIGGDGDDEEVEVRQVVCGAEHTVLLTTKGEVWVAGANHSGQLGLGDIASRRLFVRHPSFGARSQGAEGYLGRAIKVVCSRWTTYVETE